MKPIRRCFYHLNIILLCVVGVSISNSLYGVRVGSLTAPSRQSKIHFPKEDLDNEIYGFAEAASGFALEDFTTSVSIDSAFGLAGTIVLNGGTMHINRDLILCSGTTFTSMGNVYGNAYKVEFPSNMDVLGSPSESIFTFDSIKLCLNADIVMHSKLKFEGECTIDGRYNIVDLDDSGAIIVGSNSHLIIRNADLKNISGNDIRCADDTGILTLQNVNWQQASNVTFSQGSIRFLNDVTMKGDGTIFAYQSSETSTLMAKSCLYLDEGFTFSYDPPVASKNLIEFIDTTAKLNMHGATLHATTTGMDLKHGKMVVLLDSFISSETGDGITLGNSTSEDDFICDIFAGFRLKCTQGALNYKNVSSSSWSTKNINSDLYMSSGTTLNLYENLDIGNGYLVLEDGATLARVSGREFSGLINLLGSYSATLL